MCCYVIMSDSIMIFDLIGSAFVLRILGNEVLVWRYGLFYLFVFILLCVFNR